MVSERMTKFAVIYTYHAAELSLSMWYIRPNGI